MASEYSRYEDGEPVPGDTWEQVPTGRWLVRWSGEEDRPFAAVWCASEEVAQRVVGEIARWIVAGPWSASDVERLVRHEVRPVEGGYEVVGWQESRTVSARTVVRNVVVGGEVYSRSTTEYTYGEWEQAKARQIVVKDGFRRGEWRTDPERSTCAVRISCYPEVLTVLTACGVSDVPDAPADGGACGGGA